MFSQILFMRCLLCAWKLKGRNDTTDCCHDKHEKMSKCLMTEINQLLAHWIWNGLVHHWIFPAEKGVLQKLDGIANNVYPNQRRSINQCWIQLLSHVQPAKVKIGLHIMLSYEGLKYLSDYFWPKENSVDLDQTAPTGCSESTLVAHVMNSVPIQS